MSDVAHTDAYEAALRSAHWRELRRTVRVRRGNRCEACGATAAEKPLELHHRHYDTLGRERPEDVRLLCVDCHRAADAERVRTARFEGWLRARYGYAADYVDFDAAWDEFWDYIERDDE
jgi:5-methylcytosine-specific restriction endonuclease McrA